MEVDRTVRMKMPTEHTVEKIKCAVPVEGLLVLLLYISLLSELINIIRGRYNVKADKSFDQERIARPLLPLIRKSCGVCQEKKSSRSLDGLWRRMRQATNQMLLVNLRHHMITKVMMESRIQARNQEREKMQKKKQRLLGDLLPTNEPSFLEINGLQD